MQTSGSSLILIKHLFTVPGVFIKDLIYTNMVSLKGNQCSLFIAAVPFIICLQRLVCFKEAITVTFSDGLKASFRVACFVEENCLAMISWRGSSSGIFSELILNEWRYIYGNFLYFHFRPGMGKLRPRGHMRPVVFNSACGTRRNYINLVNVLFSCNPHIFLQDGIH